MTLHPSTFQYLKPTKRQLDQMARLRAAFAAIAAEVETTMPEGADKTHVVRSLRTAATWANIGITRKPNGAPR